MHRNDPHDRARPAAGAAARPAGPDESRPVPPHGPVSPDGRHAWPQPSQTSRVIVYGGVVLAAAGLTAATVLLGRKLMGSDEPAPPPAAAARMAARPQAPAQPAAQPARPRRRRRNPVLRLAELTHAVQDATSFIGMALAGFRSVAEHAQGLGDQFRSVAEAWRAGSQDGQERKEAAATSRPGFRAEPRPGDDRLHRL